VHWIALAGFSLLLAAAGCGHGDTAPHGNSDVYTALAIRSCLESSGVTVLANDPDYVDGDASGGTFHVEVDGDYATVAVGASETNAAETARLAHAALDPSGSTGDLARHRGNVAYWQLDESDAPMQAVDACLETTPTEEFLDEEL
jgi:hypothetical protein